MLAYWQGNHVANGPPGRGGASLSVRHGLLGEPLLAAALGVIDRERLGDTLGRGPAWEYYSHV